MPDPNAINRYFHGDGITEVDPLANFHRENIVRLHESVTPQELGIGDYQHRYVSVSASTLEHLQLAQETIRKVKMMLPYDSANQKAGVIYTKGESWGRKEMLHELDISNDPVSDAVNHARYQAGWCSETADLSYALLAQQHINAPVMRVGDRAWDHAYVLIGDPRDQTWGEDNTVIVDPWVRYPSATTLAQSINRHPGDITHQRTMNAAPAPEAQALRRINHVRTAEVNAFLEQKGRPEIGDELNEELEYSGIMDTMYDEKLVAGDPSTRYYHPERGIATMDEIASATVRWQLAAQNAMDNYVSVGRMSDEYDSDN